MWGGRDTQTLPVTANLFKYIHIGKVGGAKNTPLHPSATIASASVEITRAMTKTFLPLQTFLFTKFQALSKVTAFVMATWLPSIDKYFLDSNFDSRATFPYFAM